MEDKEIYKKWHELTDDHRYFRPVRWTQLENLIKEYEVRTVLEFGVGVSTLLFDNLGLRIDSYETDAKFMEFVGSHCSSNVYLSYWDNETISNDIAGKYDLAFVDGSDPRINQLALSIEYSDLIAIDDFAGRYVNQMLPMLKGFNRLDDGSTFLSVFKRDN